MDHPLRHETLHGAEAEIQHRIVPAHGLDKELHGLLFDAVFQGLLGEEPEEQRVDVLQVVSEPNLRWSNACLNFRSLSQSERWIP